MQGKGDAGQGDASVTYGSAIPADMGVSTMPGWTETALIPRFDFASCRAKSTLASLARAYEPHTAGPIGGFSSDAPPVYIPATGGTQIGAVCGHPMVIWRGGPGNHTRRRTGKERWVVSRSDGWMRQSGTST